jgi:hypothetical protein
MSYSYEEACDRGYDGPSPAQERRMRRGGGGCGGYASYNGHCGATDCSTCYPGSWDQSDEDEDEENIETVTTSKVVIARKARPSKGWGTSEIRPGDTVRVQGGFSYEVGGPRLGYAPKSYTRIAKGPGWNTDTVATVGG